MFNQILQTTKNGHYQEVNDRIQNAIDTYTKARETIEDQQELGMIRSNCEEALAAVLVESGFADSNTAFVSIEQEFFPEGYLDKDRVKSFQMRTLLNLGEQQINWIFAGTTANYSPITQKMIHDSGKNYSDLLPKELKDKYQTNKKEQQKTNKDTDFRLYLYTDGTTSTIYNQSKAKINLSTLEDKSGFDWTKGYSPDHMVKRNNWTAGFNNKGEWEMIQAGLENSSLSTSTLNQAETIGEMVAVQPNSVSFLSVPGENSYILIDPTAILQYGHEEDFYSLNGDLYGNRSVDIERSINSTHAYLKRNKVTQLTGIVVPNKKKETIAYYKKTFPKLVTEKTTFYTPKSKKLREKINKLQNTTAEKAVSKNVIKEFVSLSKQGRKGQDLFDGLTPSVVTPEYEIQLNIYETKEDLNSFVSIPEIQNIIEEDTKVYLNNIEIPEEKKETFSNVTQNILNNFNTLFKHNPLGQKELLEQAYNAVIKNDNKILEKLTIVREKRLPEFIKHNKTMASQTTGRKKIMPIDIPSFKQQFKEKKDYADITTDAGFTAWSKNELEKQNISEKSIKEIKKLIDDSDIKSDKKEIVSHVIQDTFDEFKSIQSSTGIPATELTSVILNDVLYSKVENRYLNKKIYFEKDLASLINEASQKNINKIKVTKHDSFIKQSVPVKETQLNLMTEKDLRTLQLSPFMRMHGLTPDEQQEIINELKQSTIESDLSREFSKNVIRVLENYDRSIRPKNISPVDTIKAVRQILESNTQKIDPDIKKTIQSIIKTDKSSPVTASDDMKELHEGQTKDTVQLDLFNKEESKQFMELPIFTQSGLTPEQFETIINTQKNAYLKDTVSSNIVPLPEIKHESSGSNIRIAPFGTNHMEKKYIHSIPVHFLSQKISLGNSEAKAGQDTKATTRAMLPDTKQSSQLNTVEPGFFGPDRNILFTPQDELTVFNTTISKQKIEDANQDNYKTKIKNITLTSFGKKTIQNDRDILKSNMIMQTVSHVINQQNNTATTPMATTEKAGDLVYTAPFISPSQRGGSFNSQQSIPAQPMNYSSGQQHTVNTQTGPSDPGTKTMPSAAIDPMARVNANYIADKQALARNDNGGNQPAASGKPGGQGNKIKKGVDELFDEFINKIEYDM